MAIKLQDGIFGTNTRDAVKKYQTALKLSSDGIVDKRTWAALLKIVRLLETKEEILQGYEARGRFLYMGMD